MKAILKKELKSYFLSPIGYIVVGIFLLCFSIFFYLTKGTMDLGIIYYYTAMYGLILIVPLLTMRMFSEERKTGTEQLILTSPTSILSVVFGKLIASIVVVLIALVLSTMFLIIVNFFGSPNIVAVLISMFGFLLMSIATLSFGMFISSLTENQIISGVLTIGFLIISLFIREVSKIFAGFSLMDFYASFAQGVLSIENMISLILFSIVFIVLTVIVMQRRRVAK